MSVRFEGISLDEAYRRLDALAPQTPVEIGPGVSIKRKENGIPVMRIHYDAIPERNSVLNPIWSAKPDERHKYGLSLEQWKLKNERAKYTGSGWDREQEINDEAGGGQKIFASTLSLFDRVIVIRDPYWIPDPAWDVVGGFDHGKTNATAFEKAYVDFDGNIYMCGEFYQMATENWANTIGMNVPVILQMPHLERMRWVRADPSIFDDTQAQEDGTFAQINDVYRKQGFRKLTPFPRGITQEDLSFETRMNEHWGNLDSRSPTLYIVCRNESDRRQPGLHPYDSPNLLWELRRWRRRELTARQLIERNPTEKIVDKDNHAIDASKYIVMSLPKPAEVPVAARIQEAIKDLNPMSQGIAIGRFLGTGPGSMVAAPNARRLDLRNRGRMSR